MMRQAHAEHNAQQWYFWALLAAIFAAATALLAKVGVADINSNFATFIRTVIIVLALGSFITITGEHQPLAIIPHKTMLFLVLSGLATGLSWLCYFKALQMGQASQVAPIDK